MTTLSGPCYLSSITINGFDPLPAQDSYFPMRIDALFYLFRGVNQKSTPHPNGLRQVRGEAIVTI